MLALRLASALAGIPVLVAAIWLGGPWFLALVAVAAALGAWEYHRLARAATSAPPFLVTLVLTLGLVMPGVWEPSYLAIALGAALAVAAVMQVVLRAGGVAIPLRLVSAAGPFYVGVPLALAVLLRDGADGFEWALTAILCTFAVDTAAYAAGKLLGKRQLAPGVSPGKTWEGTIGGALGGVGGAFGLTLILELPMALWLAAPFGLMVAAAAVLGDLAESWLKRAAGAKDSGALMPGHGGLLDRMDSVLATLVVTYLWAGLAL